MGAGYPVLGYETSIVGAFGMSLLQELNGRNANNPLSHISMEKTYGVTPDDGEAERPLRADLLVRLEQLKTGSRAFSAYGFRHSNWIEAKFFRKTADGTKNVGLLLADIIRLITLPPLEKKRGKYGVVIPPIDKGHGIFEHRDLLLGRYLLHVYQGKPESYVAVERNSGGGRTRREWVHRIQMPGRQLLILQDLDSEPKGVYKYLGKKLVDLKASIDVTNFVLAPRGANSSKELFYCILTRIEGFKITLDGHCWSTTSDRRGFEKPQVGAFDHIRKFVAKNIALKDADKRPVTSAKTPPEDADEDALATESPIALPSEPPVAAPVEAAIQVVPVAPK